MKLTKTDKAVDAFEKEIKKLLAQGKTPEEAVKLAYEKYPVMKIMEKEINLQLISEMNRGANGAFPLNVLRDATALVWTADKLTLSQRTTKNNKEIIKQAADIIANAIKKGKSVQKTALALFDGYGYGHVLPAQDIPKFMKKLSEIGKLNDYKGREFRKTLRDVERQLKRVNVQGMKIAYGKIKEAIETGNEKKINKAVYVATQERTRYFARRIARTELARAYGDGVMAKWENDEDCAAFQWKLSTGHPFCDICDLYAHADLYGMGPGIFPKDKVPRLPVHPNCMCHLRPVMEGSKLLQGKEKEQIDKGGMTYIKTLDKHDQERLLGVHGRLEVLKSGNWTEKARGYSTEYMKSRIENGKIKDKKEYKVADSEKIKELQKQSDEVYKKLNKEEREALSEYTQGGYIPINSSLAIGEESFYEKDLNDAINKFILKDDIITYRGTNEKYYKTYKIGDVFKGKVFYSTSLDYEQAKVFADDVTEYDEDGYKGVLLEIKVPKKSKALYIGSNTDYKEGNYTVNEHELLLSNKVKYKIEKIEKGKIVLEVLKDE